MKTSNLLLTSIVGIIVIYTLMAMTEVRLRSEPRKKGFGSIANNSDLEHSSETLSPFQHVYIKSEIKKQLIVVTEGTEYTLTTTWHKNEEPPTIKPSFQIQGDTLLVSIPEDISRNFMYAVTLPTQQLKSIIGENANINLKDYNSHALNLSLDKSTAIVMGSSPKSKLSVKAVNNSNININVDAPDTLVANISASKMHVHQRIDVLQGTVNNNSRLFIAGANQLQFEIDRSSRFNYFNK